MTFFIDANVIVYGATSSEYRAPCLAIIEAVAGGEADGRTSAAVLEEVWHLELSGKAEGLNGLTERAYGAIAPLLAVTEDAFRLALSLDASELGANDRLHAGTCLAHGIEVVVSADRGFDELSELRRVDPLDATAVGRLVAGSAP